VTRGGLSTLPNTFLFFNFFSRPVRRAKQSANVSHSKSAWARTAGDKEEF
jgi:hypothetical protein